MSDKRTLDNMADSEYISEMYKRFKEHKQREWEFSSTNSFKDDLSDTVVVHLEKNQKETTSQTKREDGISTSSFVLGVLFAIVIISGQTWIIRENLFRTTEIGLSNSDKTSRPDGCSADSFMLKDGVCDELTNIKRCLFDGGDCCKSDKNEALCKVCTCKMDIDHDFLNESYFSLDVNVFQNMTEYSYLVTAIGKSVDAVENLETCTQLCLDKTLENKVNSWVYNFDTRKCDCTWVDIDATYCIKEVAMLPIFDYSQDLWYSPSVAMVQAKKSLPCECMLHNVKATNTTLTFDGDLVRDPPSAWHCQKSCQESNKCSHFSWRHRLGTERTKKGACFHLSEEDLTLTNTSNWWITAPSSCTNPSWSKVDNVTQFTEESATTMAIATIATTSNLIDEKPSLLFLLAGGLGNGMNQLVSEAFFYDSNQTIPDHWSPPALPDIAISATGDVLTQNGTQIPVFCGGDRPTFGKQVYTDECYIVSNPIKQFATMATARSSAASIKVLNGSALWITGGVYKEQILPPPTEPVVHLVNTTELIFVNGTAMPGPDLPANLLNHCLVQSGPNKFIFTTGDVEGPYPDTYQYNWDNGEWTINEKEGALKREHEVCGIIETELIPEKILVVAGGRSWTMEYQDSIVTCRFSLDGELSPEPCDKAGKMPLRTISASSAITDHGTTLIIVGGYEQNPLEPRHSIYAVTCLLVNICEARLSDQELTAGRYEGVLFLLSDTYLRDCFSYNL